ncbi:MAG: HD domain-containing phosphohydrolase [Alphaproteobacteria bacterium]
MANLVSSLGRVTWVQPSDSEERRRYPFHVYLSTLFTALIVAAMGVLGWYSFDQMKRASLSAGQEMFESVARSIALQMEQINHSAEMLVDLQSDHPIVRAGALDERLGGAAFMGAALDHSPFLSALYVGYGDGEFFILRSLRSSIMRSEVNAPPRARYLVENVERGMYVAPNTTYAFLDDEFQEIARRDSATNFYDPRQRPWFMDAMQADGIVRTAPYVYFLSEEMGVTIARRAKGGGAVVGADFTLESLSFALANQPVPRSTQMVLYTGDGVVLAYQEPGALRPVSKRGEIKVPGLSDLNQPALTMLAVLDWNGRTSVPVEYAIGDEDWIGRVIPIESAGSKIMLAITAPRGEILAAAERVRRDSFLIAGLAVAGAALLAIGLSVLVSRKMRALAGAARAIRAFDFAKPIGVASFIREIDDLAMAMQSMKTTIHKFLKIGSALEAERDYGPLLQLVLSELTGIVNATAGVIYLVDDDDTKLEPVSAISAAGVEDSAIVSNLPAMRLARDGNGDGGLPAFAFRNRGVESLVATTSDARIEGLGLGPLLGVAEETRVALLAVPLVNRRNDPIGVLLLADSGPQALDMADKRLALIRALSGIAGVAIENSQLFKAQKDLFDAVVKIQANAIDAKSRYTWGHCLRVPVLTKMLAEETCRTQSGPFRDFNLSPEQWEALDLAAWLHDCGKVTTPEFVVDKATKLETVYDRIHEVRMRFEVLKRDAEIEHWKAIANGSDPAIERRRLQARWAELDEEFALVAHCNEGSEFTSPEVIARIRRVGERRWLRTLDDRIGISWEERLRKQRTPASPLPVLEPLLADRAEHIIHWADGERLAADNAWGIRMAIPEHKYNRGEIYNLSIARGTLNNEERFKINDHIIQTIVMLESLPFPKHLRNVPEMAGGHHEKMDGTGYPKRLKACEMSVPARMMAIADVFEALTAGDRPYKKAKHLSEAIAIIGNMKRDGHLDPDLVDLFLTSGVWRAYAERFLSREQIDEPDLDKVLAIRPAA